MSRRLVDLSIVLVGVLLVTIVVTTVGPTPGPTRRPAPPSDPAALGAGVGESDSELAGLRAEIDMLVRLASAGGSAGAPGTRARTLGGTTPLGAARGIVGGKDGSNGSWAERADRPRRRVRAALTPEMIERCLAVARDIDADLAEQLERLRDRDHVHFEEKLRQSRRLIALAELRERDPILYDLKRHELEVDAQVSRLASEARRARREGRASDARVLEEQLRPQVILELAFRYRNREDYLCRMQELVERLQAELDHDRRHFDEVLEERVRQLLDEPPRSRKAVGASSPLAAR